MKWKFPTVVLVILLTGWSTGVYGSEIEDLLRRDGTFELLEEIPLTLEATVRDQLGIEGDPDGEAVSPGSKRLLSHFAASRLRTRIAELLGISWRIDEGRAVRSWFDSPLGAQLRDADRALRNHETQRLMGIYVGTFGQLSSQEERVALAKRILEARRDVERLEVVSRTAIELSLRAIQGRLQPEERLTPDELAEETDLALMDLAEELEDRARWRVLFTHRSATLDEIRQHAEFLEGGAARWYFEDVNTALARTLREATASYLDPSGRSEGAGS